MYLIVSFVNSSFDLIQSKCDNMHFLLKLKTVVVCYGFYQSRNTARCQCIAVFVVRY